MLTKLRSFIRAHRKATAAVATVTLVVLVAAMAVFKPWLLFVDTTVNDALPVPVAPAPSTPQSQASASAEPAPNSTESATTAPTTPAGPQLVSSGTFTSHEHTTTGTASIYRQPDGTLQLALANLSTSNGPDVRVWLSAGPVIEGTAGWFTAKDHAHLDVAPIKGNLGNQLYNLPAGTDLSQWQSVVLWCEDFSVSFGAAALSTPA
ncbi:Electron transfer DM13 [Actinomyces bovis]|uniref:Electron transfer DM13 n=1 Tax=Actinomyces bovis TaxID=1658 RepID=A0ABY1VMF7_9ACTO|nr:DM13 domain-containing protein [Actinomyces bovis]SPT53265.1 Electron transfer DM13 [Actinomyces bovis]VEG52545.1 Electron transfer DM13 [Actinomyces israelii]